MGDPQPKVRNRWSTFGASESHKQKLGSLGSLGPTCVPSHLGTPHGGKPLGGLAALTDGAQRVGEANNNRAHH